MNFWKNKKVFIAGGAGFIGHHLLDQLIQKGALVTIGDNLSSGDIKNVIKVWKKNKLAYKKNSAGYQTYSGNKFIKVDFKYFDKTIESLKNHDIVFHLAANFGGRGYIDTHPADCCENFAITQNIINASLKVGIDRIQYASTACVYPFDLQKKYNSQYLLKENDAINKNWANADREYGWAKLMGELSLKAYFKQYKLKSSVTRYVTAYGPGENDTHAIIALIRRAVKRQDPYKVWGSGRQDRDFTYVDDIVCGTILACERVTDATPINLGTSKRYTMIEVIDLIFDILKWHPKKIFFDKSKPEGVKTRALDIRKAKKILGWKPHYDLKRGLIKTIDWFLKERPKSVEVL